MSLIRVENLEARRLFCVEHSIVPANTVDRDPIASIDQTANPEPPAASTAQLSWNSGKSMPQRREEGASAVLGGKLYVFGGFYDSTFTATGRSDRYDPASNTWSQRASIPEAITHSSAVVINGEAWLFGGYVGKDPGPATQKVFIYNATSNTWRRGPDMPAARGAGAAVLSGETVYYFGGRNGSRTYDMPETWALNLNTSQWSVKASMPNPRNHIAGASAGGMVYAIGGQWKEASQAVNQRTVNRYDPTTDTWVSVAQLPIGISHNGASTFGYNGKILVVGGEKAHNVSTARVYLYDPPKNSWRFLGDMPAARRAPAAGIINGRLYVAGGSIKGSQKYELYISGNLDSVL